MLELHLTTPPLLADRSEPFAALCKALGGKALVIELSRGAHTVQPMATFHMPGCIDQVHAAADGLSTRFNDAGHMIVRRKIEFDLHAAPSTLPAAQYVEWHGRVQVADAQLEDLRALCERSGAHLSHNALRHSQRRFMTVRADSAQMLAAQVSRLRTTLAAAGWMIEHDRWEGVAFDSNLQLDQGWL